MRFRAFLFCLAVAVTIAAILWPILGGEYAYGQFVVGGISWQAENKAVDYQALLIVIVVFLALAWALRQLIQRVAAAPDAEAGISHLLGLALLPLLLWLGTALVHNTAPGFPYAWAFAAGALGLFGAWLWRTPLRVDSGALADLGELVLCSLLLSLFAGIGALLALFHASGHALPRSQSGAELVVMTALFVDALVIVFLFARSENRLQLRRSLLRWLLMLQLPLPLLGLVLLPAQLAYRGGLEPYVWPLKLLSVLALYAALAWKRLAGRLRQTDAAGSALISALDPLALAMVAVFLTIGHATFELLSAPGFPTLVGDDFHLGEQILPWQQLVDFHKIPYVDFAPIHGLMPLITGALNQFFFDGTLANLNASFSILVAISSVITVCLACRHSGVVLGLVLCFLLAPFDRLLFLAPALLLLADAKLLARPGVWLGAWCLSTIFMVGYNAAVGSAFAGGTAPFALLLLLRLCKAGPAARRKLAMFGAAGVAVLVLAPYLREVLVGLSTFIVENGTTNMVGHGLPLARGFGLAGSPPDGVLSSRLLFELVRLSWIAIALFALQNAYADWRASRTGETKAGASFLPFATGLTLLLLSAWSMGRIDPEVASRPGAVSFLAVGTLLPILYVARRGFPPFRTRGNFALIVALFVAMHGLQDRFSPSLLALRGLPVVEVPAAMERISGADFGGSRLGTIFVSPERKAQLLSFNDALRHVLAPGQTYFDLTNSQALYFYLNLPVPALYSANFNALNENQQRRMLRQLSADPPAAVFVSPAMEGDAINASLRSFFLYRHFARSYRPVAYGPYTFLVNDKSPAAPGQLETSDEALLDQAFAHPDLQMLAATWGRSWPTLNAKARFLGELANVPADSAGDAACRAPNGAKSQLDWLGRYQLSLSAAGTERADLIEIRLHPDIPMPKTLVLRYLSARDAVVHTITMRVAGTRLIVPVSSYPSWLRDPGIRTIDLCAPAGHASTRDLIAGVSAWKIPDLLP